MALLFLVLLVGASIITEKLDETEMKRVNREHSMQREMFKLGASMYRSQVVNTYGDSLIFPIDSLFIKEVYDYNDTLGREMEGDTFEN